MILQGTGNPVKAFLLPGTVAFDSCHCCCRAKVPLIVAEHQPNFAIWRFYAAFAAFAAFAVSPIYLLCGNFSR